MAAVSRRVKEEPRYARLFLLSKRGVACEGRFSARLAVRMRMASESVTHAKRENEIEFTRIVAFSDGVFAIAITLLVLALEVPSGVDISEALSDRGEEFFAYFLSFAVIGRLWISHHRFFAALSRFDTPLVAINLVYLAFLALLPFTSEALGNYGGESDGVALYAANLTIISVVKLAMTRYALVKALVEPELVARVREDRASLFVVGAVFAVWIPIAFVSPLAATISWASLFVIGDRFTERLAGPDDGG